MKITKMANGKSKMQISKKEWERLGQSSGWSNGLDSSQEPVAKTESGNPLNGRSKQSAKTFVYNNCNHLTKGLFTDNSWENVHAIFKKMDELGIENLIESTRYYKDERNNPSGKIWSISLPFINNKGREDSLLGTITAAGAGTVSDPLSRYDLTLVIG